MKNGLLFFFLLVFFLFSENSDAQVHTPPGGNSITGLSITGLKRTKLHTAEEPLKRFIGMDADVIDFDEVRAAVIDTGILEPLEVGTEDNRGSSGKILWVKVREKWAVFPVPIAFVNSDGYSAGGMFIDANALGLNDKFALGGMYGSSGWMVSTAYIHAARGKFPGVNAAFYYSSMDRQDRDENNNAVRKFHVNSLSAITGVRFKLSSIFSVKLGLSFYRGVISPAGSSFAVPGDDGNYINLSTGINLDKKSWDGYFLYAKSIGVNFSYAFGLDAPWFYTLHIQGIFEQVIIPGLKAWLRAGVLYAPGVIPLLESKPSSVSVNILPKSFSAKNFFGGSAGLEKSIYRFSFGTLSLSASYQVVYSEGSILGGRLDHGIAGGIQFYMSKLAMPALGLGVAYNVPAEYFQVYFNFGMSF